VQGGWYDFEAKYSEGGMRLVVPARISAAARDRVRFLACEAFTLAGCSGLARVDFFVDGEDVLLNELNTMPGQTPFSVYGKLWAADGLEYPHLLEQLCRVGIERHAAERSYRF
jgi:D-alanine-D-alanine ligase